MISSKAHSPEQIHRNLLIRMPQKLAFNDDINLSQWKEEVKSKYLELLGDMPEDVDPELNLENEIENENFWERKFTFQSEENVIVPCILLTPKRKTKPFPLVICIQGHTSRMHISLGRKKYEGDEKYLNNGDRDFGIQAVRNGYAALMVEMRCFGERKSNRSGGVVKFEHSCRHAAMVSLLLGRTMLGERVWDVSKSIDVIGSFDDIACLIAPRPLIVVAGKNDPIFPFKGVEKAFRKIEKIYNKAGIPDNCKLIIGDGGHRFYEHLSWPVWKKLSGR